MRVVVADDHPVFRAGLLAVLSDLPDLEVVAEAADGAAAIDAVARHRPDVVLMDLKMDGMDGLAATSRITAHHPGTAVLVLTMHANDETVFAALRAGARGYLLKEAAGEDVRRAILAVARGEAIFGPRIAHRVIAFFAASAPGLQVRPFPQLTDREQDILHLLAAGLDNTAIGQRLFLSPKTVRNRVSDILTKLSARSRAEAVALARDAGLGTSEQTPIEDDHC
ncbi:response regulator transcription factor [Planobispora rosea]|uniref:response regulator transcription factor n=1 Tax=Planobispora rosea TaxID=35762 RepID=UPI001FD582FF|nr:response regulator transcription factor [Planobispora rosea]